VPGGRLIHKWLVAPDLERIFRYRRRILGEMFEPSRQVIAR
jgi:hypothetical protein